MPLFPPMYPGFRAQEELLFPRAGEATSTTALNQSVIMKLLQKMGQATCGWVLLSGMVQNLALSAHVQLSALGGTVDLPKAISMWCRKQISGTEIPESGRTNPPSFPLPVV